MDKKTTMKNLRTTAETLIGERVTTKAKLVEALPVLIELQSLIDFSSKNLKAARDAAKALADQCTEYAVEHQSVFDDGKLHENQQGVMIGDISLETCVYHLACGYDGYCRDNGENMSQKFLATLPPEWCSTTTRISTSKVNDAKVSDKELEKYGLKQKPNNVWSLQPCV